MAKKGPWGVKIFGALIIVTSLWQFQILLDTDNYKALFCLMPERIMCFRYTISIILRVLGLIFGIGLLCRREFFRRLTIGLFWLSIVTIYLRHPYWIVAKDFKVILGIVARSIGGWEAMQPLALSLGAAVAFGVLYFFDLSFSLLLIAYLSRRDVKQWFGELG